MIEQEERFFLATLDAPLAMDDRLAATHAAEEILGHRWWTMAELASTTEVVFPADLAERLR